MSDEGFMNDVGGEDDSSDCTHPADAVMWNEFNQRTQCHRCGQTMPSEVKG